MSNNRRCAALVPAILLALAGCGESRIHSASTQPVATTGGTASTAVTPKAPESELERFFKIRTPQEASLLPDGTLLMRDWPEGVWQLYRVRPSVAGGTRSYKPGEASIEQMTTFVDGLSSYSLSPDGSKVILAHAAGGNENTQLTLMDPAAAVGSPTVPILSNPKVQAAVNCWLADSSGFVYSANDESPADFYLYRHDFASGSRTKVLGNEGSWAASDITADGRRILVAKFNSASDSVCHELDVSTGTLTDVTLRKGNATANCGFIGYMPGETAAIMTSDYQDGIVRLFVRELATGSVTEPLPALRHFDIDGAAMNTERTMLAVATNEDGYGALHVYALPDFKEISSPVQEKGVAGAVQMLSNTLVWSNNNARNPGRSFSTVFGAGGSSTTQLTYTEDQGIDLSRFPLPDLVKFKSFDGLEIPAFLWTPPGYVKGHPIPFVVNYHGGPEGQHRPTFSATIQYLLNRGYGVLQPNVRGSTGYGRAFHMMDDYTRRWDSVRDGVEAARFLVREGYARAGKIAAFGGSYGGFMSVATIVEDQEAVDQGRATERVFGASIDVVGIVNMKTFLEQTSGYRRKLRENEYGPLTDPAFLESVSPIKRVDAIRVPMLIAHGLNDPRVPVGEAMQLAVELQKRGFDPEQFYAPDEGHGFVKLENRLVFYERVARFLGRTIGE